MVNVHHADERQRLMLTCCYQAVREHFSHIAIRDIIEPPHALFDALLARQCAVTLMRDEFNVPRRRIATMRLAVIRSRRSRTASRPTQAGEVNSSANTLARGRSVTPSVQA